MANELEMKIEERKQKIENRKSQTLASAMVRSQFHANVKRTANTATGENILECGGLPPPCGFKPGQIGARKGSRPRWRNLQTAPKTWYVYKDLSGNDRS
jgi:hypothetical protein